MLQTITFDRYKSFIDCTISLSHDLSLLAGPQIGKSTLFEVLQKLGDLVERKTCLGGATSMVYRSYVTLTRSPYIIALIPLATHRAQRQSASMKPILSLRKPNRPSLRQRHP